MTAGLGNMSLSACPRPQEEPVRFPATKTSARRHTETRPLGLTIPFFLHFILLCRAGRTRPCRTLTGCRPVSQQPVRTVCAAMSFLVPFCSYTYLVQQRNSLRHFAIFPQNLPKKKLCRRHIGLGAPPSATSRVFGCRFSLFLAGRERFPKRNGCSCFGVCGLRA